MNYHLGLMEAAEKDLLQSLQIEVNAPDALNPLALVYLGQQRLVLADSVINLAISLAADQPYFINNKGLIQIHLGNYDLADSLINYSLTLDPNNSSAMENLELLETKR